MDQQVTVDLRSDVDAAVALMTVGGPWGRALWQASSDALRDCLGQHPEALIVDLTALHDPPSASAPTWLHAQRAAGLHAPAVHLALCIPPQLPLADRMQRLCGPYLPVYARVRQARVAIAGRLPQSDRLVLHLPPAPETPSLARNLVTDACLAWDLPDLLHPARLVMSELVTNAVEHARTDLIVAVSRRGDGLHLSVADLADELPRPAAVTRPRPGVPLDERGRGLRTVAATAAAWGSLPTRTGKVVWATLQPPRRSWDAVSEPR